MLTILTLLLVLAADPLPKGDGPTPRQPNPFAPSLPQLTDEEEKQLDDTVERFIAADTGKQTGPNAKKAIDDFKELGPEATFALIRGMNKAAKINHSCPALTIARKLAGILKASDDKSLLLYAKENIGAGIKQSQHMDTIKDLRSGCTQRLAALKNAASAELKGVKP